MKFTGTLTPNLIFGALFNMIISQQVFADNIVGTKSALVDRSRRDGSLYGDTKLYYATDVLKSAPWGADEEAPNLLKLYRPKAPQCQAIKLDTFRQIAVTVDNYLTKQAWSTEGAFSEFNSVMLGWIRDTKRIYDSTLFNVYIGTTITEKNKQHLVVDVTTATEGLTGEEKSRVEAGVIGQAMADLLVDLEDATRLYNDYGNKRSTSADRLMFVWNSKVINRIEKRDLPTIFHKDFIDKFAQYTLPARYFGVVNTKTTLKATAKTRSLIEQDITFAGGETIAEPIDIFRGTQEMILQPGETINAGDIGHVFPGELIPKDTAIATSSAIIYPSYEESDNVLFKVMDEDSVPYMSAFEVATNFFNPKSLTETHYLTFGHNTLEYLQNRPFITATQA